VGSSYSGVEPFVIEPVRIHMEQCRRGETARSFASCLLFAKEPVTNVPRSELSPSYTPTKIRPLNL